MDKHVNRRRFLKQSGALAAGISALGAGDLLAAIPPPTLYRASGKPVDAVNREIRRGESSALLRIPDEVSP